MSAPKTPTPNPYAVRFDMVSSHLFENGMFSLYDEDGVVNLTAGAPGPDLLAKCCDIFDEATRHRMVSGVLVEIDKHCLPVLN